MNILYLGSHAILEYDQVRLWTDLGYDVFSIGAYTDPAHPAVDLRPAIDAPYYPELAAMAHEQRVRHAHQSIEYPVIDWAKADLHQGLIDWADTIIVDCFPESWIGLNWPRIRDKRVVWRTIGQSSPQTERTMLAWRQQGLQIVRYSPAEKRAFEKVGVFAGEDALIRFGKDPADWYGWTGGQPVVGNVTQDMVGRGAACGLDFWLAATGGLPAKPAGGNSDRLPGGVGALSYDAMRTYLRSIRVYLYTGTIPASYTLGLIEAMMTGCPVVSIGAETWMPQLPELFEAADIALLAADDPAIAQASLRRALVEPAHAGNVGDFGRAGAIALFGIDTIGRQWRDFLGSPAEVTWQTGELVTA